MSFVRVSLAAVLCAALVPSARADELTDRITINGYTNFEFEKQLGDEGFGDPNGSFDADQFDLVFNVHAADRVRVAADFSWEHGTATEEGRGNQALEYGFVEYTVKDWLKLRAGKMLTPFGIYNEFHTAKPAFLSVKEAPALNKTERAVRGGLRLYPRWGSGLAAHGDVALGNNDLTYDVLVANGVQPSDLNVSGDDDDNPFEHDTNGAKSLAFRVRFEPNESLRLGYSFYHESAKDLGIQKEQSHGLELEWSLKNFRLQAEMAFTGLRLVDAAQQDQFSWYAQVSYALSHGVTPYVQYNWVNPNRDRTDDDGSVLVTGVNVEISKNFQVKLENDHFHGGSATRYATLSGQHYDEFKSAVVLGF